MTNQNKGFFEKLFDFSFSTFVAPQVAGVLYMLILGILVLGGLFVSLAALTEDFVSGLGVLIAATVGVLLYSIFLRLVFESFVATVRTAENTRILAENVLNNTGENRPNP
jgi:protein-S-isoprenylcysteine O-methyltransferase Ste14